MLVHAAGESSPGTLKDGTFAVVLGVADEAALGALAIRLLRNGVAFTAIREPDAPWHNQLMALGLAPALKSRVGRHVSDVPLLKSISCPGRSTEDARESVNAGSNPAPGTILRL